MSETYNYSGEKEETILIYLVIHLFTYFFIHSFMFLQTGDKD